jgi:hypothetical protein
VLRKHERRSLDEIERRLAAEEPGLARDFAASEVSARRRSRTLSVLTWASVALAVMSLLLGELVACLVAVLVVAALTGLRHWRLHT